MPKNNKSNAKFYTKLLIYRTKQLSFLFLLIIAFIFFSVSIFGNMIAEKHWLFVALPISLLGTAFIFVPPTEEWEYIPWQNESERYEYTSFD